jgi:5'-3' exonuclease
VLGAPFVTKKFEKRGGELYIKGIFTPTILKSIGFDYKQFRDLCFLLGCDFNDRVPGIGKARAFDLMVKYRSFDAVVDHLNTITNKDGTLKYDTSSLNYSVCNELLTPTISGYADKTDELNVVNKDYDDEFKKYNLRTLIDTLLSRTRNLGPAENVPKN